MSNAGTNEAEQSLNSLSTEEELADQILTAVSEGDAEEMSRLFTAELSPDAEQDEEEVSEEDTSKESSNEEDSDTDDDSGAGAEDSIPSPNKQEPSPLELRLAQLERELNDTKATSGRIGYMQSRLAQLEAQLKKKEEEARQSSESDAEAKLRERIAQLKEVDPTTAEILEMLTAKEKTPEPVRQENKSAEVDEASQEYVRQELHKVLAVHTDATSIFKHPAWHLWKDTLTPEQRAWAESSHSHQVNEAIAAFKQYRNGLISPQVQEAVVQEEVVDATQTARKNKLQRSADGGDAPLKKSPKFDQDAFFLESYEKIAKEAGINY